jgi:hypothetical protein
LRSSSITSGIQSYQARGTHHALALTPSAQRHGGAATKSGHCKLKQFNQSLNSNLVHQFIGQFQTQLFRPIRSRANPLAGPADGSKTSYFLGKSRFSTGPVEKRWESSGKQKLFARHFFVAIEL